MGILWPHSNTAPRTSADRRAPGALVYFYQAGTTTPRSTFQDANLTTPHPHPIVADAYGRFPAVFIDFGAYRERVKTAGNTQLWDTDNIPNPAPVAPEDGIDATSTSLLLTGEVFFRFKDGVRDGAVRANGRSIGNTSSGASERANPDCEALFVELWNAMDNTACPVLSGGVPTSRGANAAADFAANKALTLPDLRGRSPLGLDQMGAGSAGRLVSPVPGAADANKPGYAVGAHTHALSTAEMAAHTHSGTTASTGTSHTHTFSIASSGAHTHAGTTGVQSASHSHSHNQPAHKNRSYSTPGFAGDTWGGADTPTSTGIQSADHTHDFSISSSGAHTHSGTTDSDAGSLHTHTFTTDTGTGSATAHNNVQSGVLGTWYIKL